MEEKLTTKEAIEKRAEFEYMNDVSLAIKVWEDMKEQYDNATSSMSAVISEQKKDRERLQAEVDKQKEKVDTMCNHWLEARSELRTCRADTLRDVLEWMGKSERSLYQFEVREHIQSLIDNPTDKTEPQKRVGDYELKKEDLDKLRNYSIDNPTNDKV